MNKIKSLKNEISNSDDEEKIKYLKLALESINQEMRSLMDNYHKK